MVFNININPFLATYLWIMDTPTYQKNNHTFTLEKSVSFNTFLAMMAVCQSWPVVQLWYLERQDKAKIHTCKFCNCFSFTWQFKKRHVFKRYLPRLKKFNSQLRALRWTEGLFYYKPRRPPGRSAWVTAPICPIHILTVNKHLCYYFRFVNS